MAKLGDRLIKLMEKKGKKVNPWAVCHASTGPEKSDKFERCVMDVKKKQGVKEARGDQSGMGSDAPERGSSGAVQKAYTSNITKLRTPGAEGKDKARKFTAKAKGMFKDNVATPERSDKEKVDRQIRRGTQPIKVKGGTSAKGDAPFGAMKDSKEIFKGALERVLEAKFQKHGPTKPENIAKKQAKAQRNNLKGDLQGMRDTPHTRKNPNKNRPPYLNRAMGVKEEYTRDENGILRTKGSKPPKPEKTGIEKTSDLLKSGISKLSAQLKPKTKPK